MKPVRMGALVLAGCWLGLGCGGTSEGDAGTAPDATIRPNCLRPNFPAGSLEEFEACGVCVAAHERVVGPHTWPTSQVHAAAVPEGLLVAVLISNTYIALVRRDGEFMRMEEHPYADPDGEQPDDSYVAPVPGRAEFWVVNNRRDARGNFGNVVLYSYDESGFRREASGETPFIAHHTALASGELVTFFRDPMPGAPARLGRIRAGDDGSVDVLEDPDFPVGESMDDVAYFGLVWPHRERGFFMAVPFFAAVERSGQAYYHRDAWLVQVSADLEILSDPVRLGVQPFDPEYTGEPDYSHPTPRVIAAMPHPSGYVSLVSQGSLPRLGAAEGAQFWIQRITPDGELVHPNPGVLANHDAFVTAHDAELLDGELWLTLITMTPLPADHVAVGWWELINRGPDTLLSTRRAQVVEPDGALAFPEPLDLGPPAGRYRIVRDFRSGGAAYDGTGGAYGLYFESDGPAPPGVERRYTIGVEAFDEHLELVWPSQVSVDACEREAEYVHEFVGDASDGLWIIWEEELREASTGNLLSLLKVTWIRSDGTFAWTGP